MTIKFIKTKKALLEKTATRRKKLEQQVSQAPIAAAVSTDLLPPMKLVKLPIKSLQKAKRRARKTEPAQLQRVMRSIQELGQSAPVLVDPEKRIVNGHIVVEALNKLGAQDVWCVPVHHLDEAERELLHVALNRIAETGDWNLEELGPLLFDLGDLGFDPLITGFTLPEVDIISQPGEPSEDPDKVDDIPEPPVAPVSVLGDLWELGEHLLLCGDARIPENYELLLEGKLADVVFTDCPWNIPIEGFVSGLGKVKHKNFEVGAGEWTPAEFAQFVDDFTQHCVNHLRSGGAFFSCIDWRSCDVIVAAAKKAGLRHLNTAVWNKGGGGGMGTYLRSAHELIPIFCMGDKLAINNVELGKHGRNRSNVWSYPGANRLGSSANKALKDHPTPKPVELVEDAIKDVTERKAIVLDPFMGSGTSILASERSHRRARGIELMPCYVDVSIRRWEQMTGKLAVHRKTGLSFQELATQRLVSQAA